jgi:glycerophosphoryl diester phosphodiesterase
MKTIILLVTLTVFIVLTQSQAPLVIGHRGACGIYPEHTLGSYQEAVHAGADYVEMDLVITKDNQLLVSHNADLGDTTNIRSLPQFAARRRVHEVGDSGVKNTWFSEDFTMDELMSNLVTKQRYAGRTKEFDGLYRLLPLTDSLQFLRATGAGVYMETKHAAYFRQIGKPLEPILLQVLIDYGYVFQNGTANPERNVVIESFESTSLQWFADRTKGIQLAQLVKGGSELANDTGLPYSAMMTSDGLDQVKKYANIIAPYKVIVNQAKVDEIHTKGMEIHIWTLKNDDTGKFKTPNEEIAYYFNMGVDGIFADWPNMLTAYKNANSSPPVNYVLFGLSGVMVFIGFILFLGMITLYIVAKLRSRSQHETDPLLSN